MDGSMIICPICASELEDDKEHSFFLTYAEVAALLNEMEHEYIINPIVRDTLARMMRFSDELARRDNKST